MTEEAVQKARYAGLYGDTVKRIARMARRSAPITHERGNWRFNDFILLIEDGRVLDVSRIKLS
ncbi:MAG: hypothetical protein KJZ83_00430 [Burkholderiaceae bacterium]|nr:hypothetical protein [Burkholderiaceae bacterium]